MIANYGKLSRFQKHMLETANNLPHCKITLQRTKQQPSRSILVIKPHHVSLTSAVSEKHNSITTQGGIRIKEKAEELQYVRKIVGIKEGDTNNNPVQTLDKHPIVKMELMMIKLIYRYHKCFTKNSVMHTYIQKRQYSY